MWAERALRVRACEDRFGSCVRRVAARHLVRHPVERGLATKGPDQQFEGEDRAAPNLGQAEKACVQILTHHVGRRTRWRR